MNRSLQSGQLAGAAPLSDGVAVLPEMRKRALVLAWLAEVFSRQPTLEAVVSYRRGQGADWLDELHEDPLLAEGIAGMIAALAAPIEDEKLVAAVGLAFNRLFVGMGGHATVAPYESAYRGNGRLFQQPFTEMNALMAELGLTVADGCAEPADHISIELALTSHLLLAASPASQAMLERLQGWVPAFCADCIARDTSGFWAGAARALAALTAQGSPYADHGPVPTQGG